MAVHQPRAFCGHPTEDNYALVALACNHSLPAIISHPTLQLETSPKHFMWAPLSPQFLLESLEAGAFSVVRNGCGGQLVRERPVRAQRHTAAVAYGELQTVRLSSIMRVITRRD